MNIIVYGAGQLGSRHLQGLAGIASRHKIFAYDPSEESLQTASQRWKETGTEQGLQLISDLNSLGRHQFDLSIIATNATHRLEALQILLERNCKLFLLEKVLFQKTEEYNEASRLLNQYEATAWVNCPRRLFEHYAKVKELIDGKEEIHMSVTGSNWGMACNSVHFLDLFAWLSNGIHFKGFADGLFPEIMESKRMGFYEVNGSLSFYNKERTHSLQINCAKNGDTEVWVRISSESFVIDVNESLGEMRIWDGKNLTTESIQPRFQSMMSGDVVESILKGNCGLTPFEESRVFHLSFINSILGHFGEYNPDFINICPIA